MKEKTDETNETAEETVQAQQEAVATEDVVEITDIEIADSEDDEEEEELDELSKLKSENDDLNRRVLRAHADLENFRKRSIRERAESIKFANKDIFLKIVDVLDNFDRAMMSGYDPKDNFAIGIVMIQKQLMEVLTASGVETLEADGKPFDPYLHEAIAQEETDEFPDHTVIEVYQKGYRFQGSLLRPVKVKVATPPADKATEEES